MASGSKITFELYCWLSVAFVLPSYSYGGYRLVLVQACLPILGCVWDWYISDTMKKNVDRIIERGLRSSHGQLFFEMIFFIVTSQLLTLDLAIRAGCFEAPPHYDFRLVRNLLACLVSNELVFTVLHQYVLHGTRWGGKIHEIHHTCRPSSFSTGFLFHPIDIQLEVSVPLYTMAALATFVLEDAFALRYALQFVFVWYTVGDHSENVKLGHYWHHHYINSNFTVYFNAQRFWKKTRRDYCR